MTFFCQRVPYPRVPGEKVYIRLRQTAFSLKSVRKWVLPHPGLHRLLLPNFPFLLSFVQTSTLAKASFKYRFSVKPLETISEIFYRCYTVYFTLHIFLELYEISTFLKMDCFKCKEMQSKNKSKQACLLHETETSVFFKIIFLPQLHSREEGDYQ